MNYEKLIKDIKTRNDMKILVRKMFSDLQLDDIDFNELIYNEVIPKLKTLGVDMNYNWNTNETNFERVIKENY